ncbi:hypothetical protein M758_4G079200 [Ceratodon purpureus]|nr:hypothetical protein M758_4G079200 [Ceratodon purpureus]
MSTFEDCRAVTMFFVKYFVEISTNNMTIKVNKAFTFAARNSELWEDRICELTVAKR